MKTALVTIFAFIISVPLLAFADPPIDGIYTSTDLGGQVLLGRYSESWDVPDGRLQMGNTANKLSWDGATLGTQWQLFCTRIAGPPVLITDTVDGAGNGFREWKVVYVAGDLILDGNGPWGNGTEPFYQANMHAYQEIKTFQYSGGVITQAIANVSIQADFQDWAESCVTISILNQEELGNTDDDGSLALNYPAFLVPITCDPSRTLGTWGEVDEITLIVTGCTVPTEDTTWGVIKSLYK
jgi:hypothetical protein